MSQGQGGATGRRLGLLLLGYQATAVAAIVLAPFRFAVPEHLAPVWIGPPPGRLSDLLLNIVLFTPLGFLADRLRGGRTSPFRIALLGAAISLGLEATQLFIPGRYSTASDVMANALGALVGALASLVVRRLVGDAARLVGRLFLDLPLIGFLWILLPLMWSASLAGSLAPMLMTSAAASAALALAAAGRSTIERGRELGLRLAPLGMAWLVIALLPLALVAPDWAAIAAGVHLLLLPIGDAVFRLLQRRERRVEPRAVWITGVALLPLLLGAAAGGGLPMLAGGQLAARQGLLGWLAGVAAFTVTGYLLAEARGRAPVRWPRTAIAPMGVSVILTVLADPAVGNLGIRMVVAMVAAAFGALLFELQRAHVTALRLEAEGSRRVGQVTNLAPTG